MGLGAGRGDVPAVDAMDGAPIKHRRRSAEDEIDPAFDVTVKVILPARIGAKRVLPADETAVAEDVAVVHYLDGHRLRRLTRVVFKCQVFSDEVFGIDDRARTAAGADGLRGWWDDAVGIHVKREHGFARVLPAADEMQRRGVFADAQNLLVSAGLDQKDGWFGVGSE